MQTPTFVLNPITLPKSPSHSHEERSHSFRLIKFRRLIYANPKSGIGNLRAQTITKLIIVENSGTGGSGAASPRPSSTRHEHPALNQFYCGVRAGIEPPPRSFPYLHNKQPPRYRKNKRCVGFDGRIHPQRVFSAISFDRWMEINV